MEKFSRICLPGSMYCLTFYLLISTKKEIEETFFFMAPTIPSNLRNKFKHTAYLDFNKSWYFKNKLILSVYMLIKRRIRWPFIFDADIYGLDFYWFLLRGLKMNYIEDGPFVFDIWESTTLYKNWIKSKTESYVKKILKRILFGEYYSNPVGTSQGVKKLYSSNPFSKTYYNGKEIEIVNLKEVWENSSQSKKDYLLWIFDLNKKDIDNLNSRNTIILTQPLSVDNVMSKQEQIEVYKRMIEKYGEKQCVIKPHPRDLIDYKVLFPNALFFNKNIPMQLLAILGANFENVSTVNSSSALSFGENANIDWWAEILDYPKITDSGLKTLAEAKRLFK